MIVEGDAGREQPKEYYGAKVVGAYSFSCPFYLPLPLSFALRSAIPALPARKESSASDIGPLCR